MLAWKALMSMGGRSEMKPTVSDRMAPRPDGSMTWRIVGSSVSNSLRTSWIRIVIMFLHAFPANRQGASADIQGLSLHTAQCRCDREFESLFLHPFLAKRQGAPADKLHDRVWKRHDCMALD